MLLTEFIQRDSDAGQVQLRVVHSFTGPNRDIEALSVHVTTVEPGTLREINAWDAGVTLGKLRPLGVTAIAQSEVKPWFESSLENGKREPELPPAQNRPQREWLSAELPKLKMYSDPAKGLGQEEIQALLHGIFDAGTQRGTGRDEMK